MEINKQINLTQSFIDLVKKNDVTFIEIRSDTVKANDIILYHNTFYRVNTIVKNNITNHIIFFDKSHNTNIEVSTFDKIPVLYINHKPISQILLEVNNQFNIHQDNNSLDTKLLFNFLDYIKASLLVVNSTTYSFIQINDIIINNYQVLTVSAMNDNPETKFTIKIERNKKQEDFSLGSAECIVFNGNQSLSQIMNSSMETTFFNKLQENLERIK